MVIRADPLKTFPAMPIMVEALNPISSDFVGAASLAAAKAEESPDNPEQRMIGATFRELRYVWAQRINTFRLFATSRAGMFRVSVEASIRDTTDDIATYDNQVTHVLTQLRALDAQGKLGFQQSESLAQMVRLREQWNANYEKVRTILAMGGAWRVDTPLLRDRIHPLFARIWEELHRIDKEIEQRSSQDIDTTTQVADQVSNSVWFLAVVVLLVALFGTVVFEFQIRRPITRVARAIKAEAAGDSNVSLPDSTIVETRDLVAAFTHMREQIHARQEHLQAVLTYAAEAIVTTDIDGRVESFNPAAEVLFGRTATSVLGMPLTDLIPEYSALLKHVDGGKEHEVRAQRADGMSTIIGLRVSTMHVGGCELRLATIADISERRAMLDDIQAREQRLRSILDNTAEGIVTFDEHGLIETWNQAATVLFGFAEREALGLSITLLIKPEAHEAQERAQRITPGDTILDLVAHEGEVVGHHKNGATFPLSLKTSRMTLDGKVKYTALLANISERKTMIENLRRMAEHDGLTGLHNRTYFHAILERTVERVRRSEKATCALLYIDLDNFKYVNDTLGHAAGDKLLVDVAQMLNGRIRRSDLVARLGGDEFVVLIDGTNIDLIHTVAESFRRHLADYAFHFEGKTVDVGCSIGVALITTETASSGEIMSQADVACHFAKRAGRNRVHVFTAADAGDVRTMSIDMGWSRRIKHALEHDHFVLALQPVVDTRTRTTAHHEVLIRMRDEDGSIIMPAGFLSTAERFGLSTDIDAWVIRHAVDYQLERQRNGESAHLAINLSGQSLTSPMITELIPKILQERGVDPSSLTFEVTETAAIADMNIAVSFLAKLRELGCHAALDDFGSGMSSFAYLRELPVDIVKIDGRFVKNIANNPIDHAMVKAMNDIAHALGKKTVAEFVEDEAHFQAVRELGVDYGQGYHLGKPALLESAAVPEVRANRREQH